MASSTKNLTLEFMQTEKGQYSKYVLRAILGLKYNHQNPYSHNFLVYFQNTNTGYPEIAQIPPELLRYKFKIDHTYQKGKEILQSKNEIIDFLRIDSMSLKEVPLYTVLQRETICEEILGNKKKYVFDYGKNSCYVHYEDEVRYIIPSSTILLYYYIRSTSMKDALMKGKIESLYKKEESELTDKDDAKLVLASKASKLDGAFICRFITNPIANSNFNNFFKYVAAQKKKLESENRALGNIPLRASFPTKEEFNIKVKMVKLKNEANTYFVHQIINDDSTLDFNKLTILKTIRKEGVDNSEQNKFPVKGRKPKKTKPLITTKTPYANYGTSTIKVNENNENFSLLGKDVIYGNIEEIDISKHPLNIESKKEGEASVSFSSDQNNGDKQSKRHTIEEQKDKEEFTKPPNFEIFKQCIEILENSGYVEDFYFDDSYRNSIPEGLTKNGIRTDFCTINNRLKEYTYCSFLFNDYNVALIEVESKNGDFATWVFSSKTNFIESGLIDSCLSLRYKDNENLDFIIQYAKSRNIGFKTHRHAQIHDNNHDEHEEIIERWVMRLFKLINQS